MKKPIRLKEGAITLQIEDLSSQEEDGWRMAITVTVDNKLHTTEESINDSIETVRIFKNIVITTMLHELEKEKEISTELKDQFIDVFDHKIKELQTFKQENF